MSDEKAVKETIRVFLVVEFCFSPVEASQKGAVTLFCPLPPYQNTNLPGSWLTIIRIILVEGWASDAKKTFFGLSGKGDL
jgi:hypothetical protein